MSDLFIFSRMFHKLSLVNRPKPQRFQTLFYLVEMSQKLFKWSYSIVLACLLRKSWINERNKKWIKQKYIGLLSVDFKLFLFTGWRSNPWREWKKLVECETQTGNFPKKFHTISWSDTICTAHASVVGILAEILSLGKTRSWWSFEDCSITRC